tara:strand:+ start:3410 stop:4141 length:732 start_codon:yes stop_codon:yes gene_type:complete
MKKAIIISVRSNSSRLEKKPYLKIKEREIITYLFENLKNTNVADLIVVATTLDENDNLLCELANNYNFEYFRGSSEDKLDRWLNTCKEFKIDCFVNVDGDDIFFDYKLADIVLEKIQKFDFIDGSGFYNDVYGVNFHALNKVCKNKKTNETEFIKPFFLNDKSLNIHKLDNIDSKYYKKDVRMTLDYPEDFIFFKKIIESIDEYSYENILNFLEENSEIKKINFFLDEQWKKNQEKKLGEIIL